MALFKRKYLPCRISSFSQFSVAKTVLGICWICSVAAVLGQTSPQLTDVSDRSASGIVASSLRAMGGDSWCSISSSRVDGLQRRGTESRPIDWRDSMEPNDYSYSRDKLVSVKSTRRDINSKYDPTKTNKHSTFTSSVDPVSMLAPHIPARALCETQLKSSYRLDTIESPVRDTWLVKVTNLATIPSVRGVSYWYIDKTTLLPHSVVICADSPSSLQCSHTRTFVYSEYATLNGLVVPSNILVKMEDLTIVTVHFGERSLNSELSPGLWTTGGN